MEKKVKKEKQLYLLILSVFVLMIVASQVITQYSINLQNADAKVLNMAERQRMLSQRITKLTLILANPSSSIQNSEFYTQDSLQFFINKWKKTHYYLLTENKRVHKSKIIDSLLTVNTPRLEAIYAACEQLIKNNKPDYPEVIRQITNAEIPFLLTMERTVSHFQSESDARLVYLKNIELILASIIIITIILAFYYYLLPLLNKLTISNVNFENSRTLLRTIIDNIPVNIYAKNRNKEKILANKSEYEYLGFNSENDVMGKTDFELFPKQIADIGNMDDDQVLLGKTVLNKEVISVRPNGIENWFIVSKVPLKNRLGEVEGIVGFSLDITERKRLNEQLEKSNQLFKLITENAQDVISLRDLDGTLTYISPACKNVYEYTPEELIGRNGADFFYPEDAEKLLKETPAMLDKLNRGLDLEPLQFRLITKSNKMKWVESVIRPIFTNNVLTGFQTVMRDISIRKEIEQSLEKARQEAEEAMHSKSKFLSVMSHEIRTPLNGIIGLTNMLGKNDPKADQIENIELLRFSSQNLLSIVNDILDFNKADSGNIKLESILFNIEELVTKFYKMNLIKATEKGITLRLILGNDLPLYVLGDPLRLGQIINNLLSNAIKFTEKGFVELTVIKLSQVGVLHTLRISVKDTGIGIAADKTASVFEMFNQADANTSRKFGGTGLGLSISKKLLAMMGSEIKLKSEINSGSEFSFELILPEAIQVEESKIREREKVEAKQLHVLVVDDNRVNLIVADDLIKRYGHQVTTVDSGKKAIAALEADLNTYQLILMDIQMPDLDGYQTVQLIRSKEGNLFKEIPIIALTSDLLPETKIKAIKSGMNDYLSKPIEERDLEKILKK